MKDLKSIKHVHIIGIGGAGLNAIANIFVEMGITVTGGDRLRNAATEYLENKGVKIYDDTDLAPIDTADLILVTSAVKSDHPVLEAAKSKNIEVITRHDLWKLFSKERRIVAVSGSHGKTTSTSMLAHIAKNTDPGYGYVVGVHSPEAGHWGNPELEMIMEADEYARTFLAITPSIAVITNIDRDHVDIYKDDADYINVFREFAQQTLNNNGIILANGDDAGVQKALEGITFTSFGFNNDNEWQIKNDTLNEETSSFDLYHNDEKMVTVNLHLIGKHNMYNATSALVSSYKMGLDLHKSAEILTSFTGVQRRLQLKGEVNDIKIYDDYAHSPREISTTLDALKNSFSNKRIICYFQPHTYSRIQAFFDDFAQALSHADVVRLGDVYAARESTGEVDLDLMIEKIQCNDKKRVGDIESAKNILLQELMPGDILVVMNAGSASQVTEELVQEIKSK